MFCSLYVWVTCAWLLWQRPKDGEEYLGTGVPESCEQSYEDSARVTSTMNH